MHRITLFGIIGVAVVLFFWTVAVSMMEVFIGHIVRYFREDSRLVVAAKVATLVGGVFLFVMVGSWGVVVILFVILIETKRRQWIGTRSPFVR